MKHFAVDIDITMSCRIELSAETEEEAKKKAEKKVTEDAYYYARNGHYVKHDVEAVNETEDDMSATMREAIEYVQENMSTTDLDALKTRRAQCYEAHLVPSESVMDCSSVIDLLEEYGEENDLPEGWWESEAEIDEILLRL